MKTATITIDQFPDGRSEVAVEVMGEMDGNIVHVRALKGHPFTSGGFGDYVFHGDLYWYDCTRAYQHTLRDVRETGDDLQLMRDNETPAEALAWSNDDMEADADDWRDEQATRESVRPL